MDHMVKLGFSKSLSEWMGSNLKKSGEHETWAFNLDGAVQMFNSYRFNSYGFPVVISSYLNFLNLDLNVLMIYSEFLICFGV